MAPDRTQAPEKSYATVAAIQAAQLAAWLAEQVDAEDDEDDSDAHNWFSSTTFTYEPRPTPKSAAIEVYDHLKEQYLARLKVYKEYARQREQFEQRDLRLEAARQTVLKDGSTLQPILKYIESLFGEKKGLHPRYATMDEPGSAPPPLPLLPMAEGYGIPFPTETPEPPQVPRAITHYYEDVSTDICLEDACLRFGLPEPSTPENAPRSRLSFRGVLSANPIQGSAPPQPRQIHDHSPSGRDRA